MMLFWMFLGCPGGPTTPTDPTDDPSYTSLLVEESPETGVLLGTYETSDSLVMVGGDFAGIGRVSHFDGDSMCVESETVEGVLWWVHGRSDTDWYAVGENGIVVHESNGTRTREDIPTTLTLFGVYDDGNDVWAVGGDVRATQTGEIWRKAPGQDWELVLGAIDGLMFKAWNGWFVGDGKAFWWDGTQLVERHPPNDAKLLTITGDGTSTWAVGGNVTPVLLEWTGDAWVEQEVAIACAGNQGLNGVWVDGDTVHIAGHNGAASSFDGTEWSCDIPPLTRSHYHATWRFEDRQYWIGGDLFRSQDNIGTVAVHPPVAETLTVETCP